MSEEVRRIRSHSDIYDLKEGDVVETPGSCNWYGGYVTRGKKLVFMGVEQSSRHPEGKAYRFIERKDEGDGVREIKVNEMDLGGRPDGKMTSSNVEGFRAIYSFQQEHVSIDKKLREKGL